MRSVTSVGCSKLKSFYESGDDLAAAMFLLKECGVASVPGSNFYSKETAAGAESKTYLRICFCRDMADLKEAVKRMQKLVG